MKYPPNYGSVIFALIRLRLACVIPKYDAMLPNGNRCNKSGSFSNNSLYRSEAMADNMEISRSSMASNSISA